MTDTLEMTIPDNTGGGGGGGSETDNSTLIYVVIGIIIIIGLIFALRGKLKNGQKGTNTV